MAFELTAVRVLALTMESTVYSFSLTLGAYLLGILLASALCSRFAATEVPSDRAAVWCGAAALALGVCAQLLRFVNPVYLTLAAAGGDSFGARILTELAVAALFVIPAAAPTTLVFCQLAPRLVRTPSAAASGVGDAFMATAIGSACAPLVVGLWAFEWDGARGGARLAVAALAVGALMLLQQAKRARLQSTLGLTLGAFALTALLPQPLFSWPPVAGRRQLFAVEGIGGAVAVEERDGVRVLRTGNRYFEGGSASVFGERRQGQLPLLLHPSPKRALVLGLGTGTTLAAAAAHPDVHVDGVELMGEVLQAMPYFNDLHAGPKLGVYQADARAFVRAQAQRAEAYDVVIADLYHPRQAGIGNLYTREHFEAIRALLAPGGHFMQWLSLHELQPADLASIVHTFLRVFPEASGWYAYFNARTGVLGLLGGNAPLGWHWDKLVARVQAAAAIPGVSETLLDRPRELMAAFVTDRAGLERIAGAGALNTDDRPLLEYAVPKSHTDDVERKLRSLDLVQRSVTLPHVSTLACGAPEPSCGARMRQLAGWQRAVDALMRGQRAELLRDEAGAVLAYQDGIRAAPDFSVNYLLLRQLALKWRQQGRAHDARALLSRRIDLDPSNDDAR